MRSWRPWRPTTGGVDEVFGGAALVEAETLVTGPLPLAPLTDSEYDVTNSGESENCEMKERRFMAVNRKTVGVLREERWVRGGNIVIQISMINESVLVGNNS